MMQVVDTKALRKLNQRIFESRFVDVRSFLEAVRSTPDAVSIPKLAELRALPRVKENANMSAILAEIDTYYVAGDFSAASKVAERVLNVPVAVQLGKPAGAK